MKARGLVLSFFVILFFMHVVVAVFELPSITNQPTNGFNVQNQQIYYFIDGFNYHVKEESAHPEGFTFCKDGAIEGDCTSPSKKLPDFNKDTFTSEYEAFKVSHIDELAEEEDEEEEVSCPTNTLQADEPATSTGTKETTDDASTETTNLDDTTKTDEPTDENPPLSNDAMDQPVNDNGDLNIDTSTMGIKDGSKEETEEFVNRLNCDKSDVARTMDGFAKQFDDEKALSKFNEVWSHEKLTDTTRKKMMEAFTKQQGLQDTIDIPNKAVLNGEWKKEKDGMTFTLQGGSTINFDDIKAFVGSKGSGYTFRGVQYTGIDEPLEKVTIGSKQGEIQWKFGRRDVTIQGDKGQLDLHDANNPKLIVGDTSYLLQNAGSVIVDKEGNVQLGVKAEGTSHKNFPILVDEKTGTTFSPYRTKKSDGSYELKTTTITADGSVVSEGFVRPKDGRGEGFTAKDMKVSVGGTKPSGDNFMWFGALNDGSMDLAIHSTSRAYFNQLATIRNADLQGDVLKKNDGALIGTKPFFGAREVSEGIFYREIKGDSSPAFSTQNMVVNGKTPFQETAINGRVALSSENEVLTLQPEGPAKQREGPTEEKPRTTVSQIEEEEEEEIGARVPQEGSIGYVNTKANSIFLKTFDKYGKEQSITKSLSPVSSLKLSNNYERGEIANAPKGSTIMVSATWCGPCKNIKKASGLDEGWNSKENIYVIFTSQSGFGNVPSFPSFYKN